MSLLENTQRYRRTPKGLLTNMYHRMRSRHEVSFTLGEFHSRFLDNKKFNRLFKDWKKNNYNFMLVPSLDRINPKKPYTVLNTQMLTWSENRFKQSAIDGKLGRKPAVLQMIANKVIRRFPSQRRAVKELGVHQGNLSLVLNGKRKTVRGYKFIYENPELSEKPKHDE